MIGIDVGKHWGPQHALAVCESQWLPMSFHGATGVVVNGLDICTDAEEHLAAHFSPVVLAQLCLSNEAEHVLVVMFPTVGRQEEHRRCFVTVYASAMPTSLFEPSSHVYVRTPHFSLVDSYISLYGHML